MNEIKVDYLINLDKYNHRVDSLKDISIDDQLVSVDNGVSGVGTLSDFRVTDLAKITCIHNTFEDENNIVYPKIILQPEILSSVTNGGNDAIVEFGEYPQELADLETGEELEKLYRLGTSKNWDLKSTGKSYSL